MRRPLFLLAALLATSPAALAQLGGTGPQIAIAHRGASAYAPEHTFFAYDLAVRQDADMLECDLILSKDEVPVCIHDETVDRTTGGTPTGRVDSYTLAELRQMDFGSWFNTSNPTAAKPEYAGAKIVTLEEQLDCYLRINPKMRFHIETKDSAGGRAEQILFEMLTRKGLIATGDVAGGNVRSSTILLQSFDAGSLERMKGLTGSIPTAFLFAAPDATSGPWLLAGSGPDYIDAFAPNSAVLLLDATATQRFHAGGHDVHTWTVNDSQQMGVLLDQGVDGIFTNNPDLLRAAIAARDSGTSVEERGSNPADFAPGCPGIAGRVTSNQGPGDVWEPTGNRGVRLKAVMGGGSSSSGGTGSSSGGPVVTPPAVVDGGRFGGGALPALLLAVLGGVALLRLRAR